MKLTAYLLRLCVNKGHVSDLKLKYPKSHMLVVKPEEDIHNRNFLIYKTYDFSTIEPSWEDLRGNIDKFSERYNVEYIKGAELT